MPDGSGTLLRGWRTARRLSLGALSLKAGVSKAALSNWERGETRPRIPELEAVLSALGATRAQRLEALAALGAPRALRRLREVTSQAPPVSGDLLRAMRLRRGWTQDEAALRAGIGQSAVARWERGDAWPSEDRLHALCFALGAHPEELAALTLGRLTEPAPVSLDALDAEHEVLARRVSAGEREVMDLRFLSLQSRVWPLAGREKHARRLLARSYLDYARWLSYWRFTREAAPFALRALEFVREEFAPERWWSWGVHLVARSAIQEGARTARDAGVAVLRQWLPAAEKHPHFEAWLLRDLAWHLCRAGDVDSALVASSRALQVSSRLGDDLRYSKLTHAETLIKAGRAGEALILLPLPVHRLPVQGACDALVWAEALHAVNERAAARAWLDQAYATMDAGGLERLRPEADAVARRF